MELDNYIDRIANQNNKWYFTKEFLESSPSVTCGLQFCVELRFKQEAAAYIQEMGNVIQLSQLCISTAIVFLHRFYIMHSMTIIPWKHISPACLLLASKIEEQIEKKHVFDEIIRAIFFCCSKKHYTRPEFTELSEKIKDHENLLLLTLGFDLEVIHPHVYVVKIMTLVRANKELCSAAYFLATVSLHATNMCLRYKPSLVAAVCVYVACRWTKWKIPLSLHLKEWYTYLDPTITEEIICDLSVEFTELFDQYPQELKDRLPIQGKVEIVPNAESTDCAMYLFDSPIPTPDEIDVPIKRFCKGIFSNKLEECRRMRGIKRRYSF